MVTLALLGNDRAALPLLRAAAVRPGIRLSVAALAAGSAPELLAIVPGIRITDRWESLLDDSIDGVIVAGSEESVLEGARRLAAEGKPLLVLPNARQGTTFFYELSLIRDDNHVVLVPALPLRMRPEVVSLQKELESQQLGRIIQIQIEREIPCLAGAGPAPLTSLLVASALIEDADLVRALGGNYSRVTALHAGAVDDGRFSSATVTLAGDGLPDALWMARPVFGDAGDSRAMSAARLIVTGAAGRRELKLGTTKTDESENQSAESAVLQSFVRAIEGEPFQPDWTAAIRAGEVVDGARRSVARRRTIDLYHETASERGQFKSHMTAIGCGVILLTLVLVIALLLVGAAVDLPPGVMRAARILVFAPLFVYLAMQVLVFVARPSRRDPPQ